jgi:uncharacterized membrane protein SirB2
VTLFDSLKLVHVCCAFISVGGFVLRGSWMLTGNPLLRRRLTRVLPHVIDTLLLSSAIGMLLVWGVSPFQLDWLSAKLVALLVYIGLGMVALRFGRTRRHRATALLLALCSAVYMFSVAYTKNSLGPLGLFGVAPG